jgi:hypothetical protein
MSTPTDYTWRSVDEMHAPPWQASYAECWSTWEVSTDRGDPSDEYSVNDASFDEATNRLWAASPELYEVANMVAANGDTWGVPREVVEKAIAAISKADFREPDED